MLLMKKVILMNHDSLSNIFKTVLSGSPNKNGSTSYIIKNIFPESDIIYINEKNISPCNDCKKCINSNCHIIDDFQVILNKADNAFALISPIYFCSFPSFVKSFIDRFQYFWQNKITMDFKYALIILHGEKGNYKAEEGLKYLSDILFQLLGAKKKNFVYCIILIFLIKMIVKGNFYV